MRIQVDVTADDYRAFTTEVSRRAVNQKHPRSLWKMIALWLSLVGVLTVVFAIAKRSVGLSVSPDIWAGGAVALIFIGFFVFFLRQARSSLSPDEDGSILGPHEIELLPDVLRVVNEHADSTIKWPGVRELLETRSHFFVMTDRVAGLIVPKRAFSSDGEASRFSEEIRSRIGSAV